MWRHTDGTWTLPHRAKEALGDRAQTIAVDATDKASLDALYEQAGPLGHLVVTVTRRGGAGSVTKLADQDLSDAFADKPVAHLQAVSLALATLAESGLVTSVGAGSAQGSLPTTSLLAAVNGAVAAVGRPRLHALLTCVRS